jgi:hypothetical protein
VRLWNVDRSQTEIEKNMYHTLTGLEYGLVGYWQLDECVGGRARDRLGKHDGVLSGGRWVRSSVGIRPNADIMTCKEPGKCSIDEVEERPTGSEFVDPEHLQNDYWKRAVRIMETQNRVNKKVIKELLMTLDTLTNRLTHTPIPWTLHPKSWSLHSIP